MTVDEALAALRRDRNNEQAWASFYRQMYRPLLTYVKSLLATFSLPSGDDAHDVVHNALTAFWERWPHIKDTVTTAAAASGYLRKTCRNLMVDEYRRRANASPLMDFLTFQFRSAFAKEPDLYRGIFLREIISRLPAKCSALLRTYAEEDLSPAEIADREGASAPAFYARWYRCIQKAKKIADECDIDL